MLDSVLTDYASVGAGRDDGVKAGEMNPVFYRKDRFDMVRTNTFWLSETPEIACVKKLGIILFRVLLPGSNWLIKTHMNISSSSIHILLMIQIQPGL